MMLNVCAAALLGAALSLATLYLSYACVRGDWTNAVPKVAPQ